MLDLLDANSLEEVVSCVEDSLLQRFQVPFVSLILLQVRRRLPAWHAQSAAPSATRLSAACWRAARPSAGVLRELSWISCSAAGRQTGRLGGGGRHRLISRMVCWRLAATIRSTTKLAGYPVSRLYRRSPGPSSGLRHCLALRCVNRRSDRTVGCHARPPGRLPRTPGSDANLSYTLDRLSARPERAVGAVSAEHIDRWSALDSARLRRMVGRLRQRERSSRSLARLLSRDQRPCTVTHQSAKATAKATPPAWHRVPPKAERRLRKTLGADRTAQLLDGALEDGLSPSAIGGHAELFYSSGFAPVGPGRPQPPSDIHSGLGGRLPAWYASPVKRQQNPPSCPSWPRMARQAMWSTGLATLRMPGQTPTAAVYQPASGRRVGPRCRVNAAASQAGDALGLGRHLPYPHMLRSRLRQYVCRSSQDLRAVPELGSYADIATTRYTTWFVPGHGLQCGITGPNRQHQR